MERMAKVLVLILSAFASFALPVRPAAAQPEPGQAALETARIYRERARYPKSSHVLRPGDIDPIRAEREVSPQSLPSPTGKGPLLAVWPAKVSFVDPQPIDLFASLQTLSGQVKGAGVTAYLIDEEGNRVADVVYQDDGRQADARAGDGIYSARLALPVDARPELAANFRVVASARLADGSLREAVGGFLYSRPAAELTGRYRDAVVNGDLVVSAQIEVTRPGRFHLAGTLYTMKGEPIGVAKAGIQLEPGRHWIELPFYGLMFHDRKVTGRFRLGSLALSTTTSMPNALNDLVEDAHVTRSSRLRQLKSTAYANSQLLETARRLEADALRAQGKRTVR